MFTPGQFYWIHEHSPQELRKNCWCCEMLCHGLPAGAVNIPWFSGYIPPKAQENKGNWSFSWRGETFEQDPSWEKEPMRLSLLLCEDKGTQPHVGQRTSMDTAPKEKSGGQQQRRFGMCWFMWVFRRKAGSYCFWWVLNCSMDCSMALNGPYPEAALGSIRSRIDAFLFVFLIPTQAFRAQAVTLNKTTRDCKCHSLLIDLRSLSLPEMWK